jgi:hypothetical protein
MPYELPPKLPAELLVAGKTYKLVTPSKSIERGVCRGNDGSWFYYFNKDVVDGNTVYIGDRRHFSVRKAKGQRAVHISLKPHDATATKAAKPDEIMIWYCYDNCWNGREQLPAGWGRTHFRNQDADRVRKAVDLLTAFLKAMDAVATGGGATVVQPVLSPPIAVVPIDITPPPPAPSPVPILEKVVDSWEDL